MGIGRESLNIIDSRAYISQQAQKTRKTFAFNVRSKDPAFALNVSNAAFANRINFANLKLDTVRLKQSRRVFLSAALAGIVRTSLVASQNENADPRSSKDQPMKTKIEFSNHTFTATLANNSSSQSLIKMLPLNLTVEDYEQNEKIAYLPSKLPEDGSVRFFDERPGDICYYAPWGNLVFYYASYRYSNGLVRLGRMDSGIEPLLTKGTFPMSIRSVEQGGLSLYHPSIYGIYGHSQRPTKSRHNPRLYRTRLSRCDPLSSPNPSC